MRRILSNNPKFDYIVKWCLEDILKLEGYDLDITFCVLFGCSGKFSFPNKINIDQHLDESQTLRTLFHEIRHYYQHIRNMFDFDFEKYNVVKNDDNDNDYFDYVKFRDEDVLRLMMLKRYHCYLNYPWELDAKEFEMETWRQWLKSGKVDSQKYIWYGNYDNYCQH